MNNGVSNEYHYSHKMQSLVISLTAQAEAPGVWLSEKLVIKTLSQWCKRMRARNRKEGKINVR